MAEAHLTAANFEYCELELIDILNTHSKDEKLDAFNAKIAHILNGLYLKSNLKPNPKIIRQFDRILNRLITKNQGKFNTDEMSAYKLKTIFNIQNKGSDALQNLRQFVSIMDTLHHQALADTRSELLVAYETKEKEQTIKIQQLELQQGTRQRNWLIALSINYQATDTHHQIIVSDNGIGIEEQYHEKIFEMFKRLHNRSEYSGSGIGLAIVKLVVGKLEGKIQLESKIGEGSQFVLVLPK